MCGICGEITFDGTPANVAAVHCMTEAMAARGPDSSGAVAYDRVAFGHRRLSIIDLSVCGAQPMVDSELGLTLVFNGCIYNYQQLRTQLEYAGYGFFSDADSEVVIKAFHRWGARCVERFKGMFAFAIAERDSGIVT
jgi:asparagine synthase (glutamine-hydrolysing)